MESWNNPWLGTVTVPDLEIALQQVSCSQFYRDRRPHASAQRHPKGGDGRAPAASGYGRPTEASLRLGVPKLGTRLPGSSMKDVLFVGLDIDTCQGYEVLIPDQQLHIGVSILDTRRLNDLLASTHERQLARVIRLVPVHYRNLELLSASAQQVHAWKVQNR